MEDGIEEIHDFVLAETKNLEGEAKANELVKNLIVNLVPAGNYDGDEEGKTDEKSGGLTEDGRKEENQKEGGIINRLISNLVSPRKCPTPKEKDERKDVGTKPEVESEDLETCFKSEKEVQAGGGGGIINNLISNMLHHHDQDGSGEEKERVAKEEKADVAGDGGRSGLVNQLISNLPTTLAENAAPGTDEASILIHSIVHD